MKQSHTLDLAPLPRPGGRTLLALGVLLFTALVASVNPLPPYTALIIVVGVSIVAAALVRPSARIRIHGDVYQGVIESKMGPYALEVDGGELRACPFVVRLHDGRIAIVDDSGLVLEAAEETTKLAVGDHIEIVGTPELTPYAPEGYRGAHAFRFRGERAAPVCIRHC